MICAIFRNMADLYAEGRLAGFQAKWMERHAAACPACAAELAAWKRQFAGLTGLPVPQAPANFKEMLRGALAAKAPLETEPAEELPGLVLPSRRWEPSMALAAGLLVLALSSSISAIGPGIPSQGYPDETVSTPRG
jgi:anti-sigma factor RsiW